MRFYGLKFTAVSPNLSPNRTVLDLTYPSRLKIYTYCIVYDFMLSIHLKFINKTLLLTCDFTWRQVALNGVTFSHNLPSGPKNTNYYVRTMC